MISDLVAMKKLREVAMFFSTPTCSQLLAGIKQPAGLGFEAFQHVVGRSVHNLSGKKQSTECNLDGLRFHWAQRSSTRASSQL